MLLLKFHIGQLI